MLKPTASWIALFIFCVLISTAAQAETSNHWSFQLHGPDSVRGAEVLVQMRLISGWEINANTTIKQGLLILAHLHSNIRTRHDGSTIYYASEGSAEHGQGAYRLQLKVERRNISGKLQMNGQTKELNYHITSISPKVYMIGDNLVNGLQAMLYGLKGKSTHETVFFPLKDLWLDAVLQSGKQQQWLYGKQHITTLAVRLTLNKGGKPVAVETLRCTPHRHKLLGLIQGNVSIMRAGLAPFAQKIDTQENPLTSFFFSRSRNVKSIHLHLTSMGRDMAGVLTIPRFGPIYGAILLIGGSGPTNMDGNNPLGLHDYIYKQLAYDFATNGYAMLRYNKASISPAVEIKPPALTLQIYAEDAAAWFSIMEKQSSLHQLPMVLMGHSEGGLVALYAVHYGLIDPQKMVLLECPGAPLRKVLSSQMTYQAMLRGENTSIIHQINKNVAIMANHIQKAKGDTIHFNNEFLGQFPLAEIFMQPGFLPLFKSEFLANPENLITGINIPILIIQGDRDVQVLPWNGKRLQDANPEYATLLYISKMSHDLTTVSSSDILHPAPPGRRLDPAMIKSVISYLEN